MPIYEYLCKDCGRISEFLLIKTDEILAPRCKRCKSQKMSRVLSRVKVIRSRQTGMKTSADQARRGHFEGGDPKELSGRNTKQEVYSYSEEELGEDLIPDYSSCEFKSSG